MRRIKIAPSFLSADFSNLERDIRTVEAAGVDYLHLDVMDAHFVPNISFGPLVVEAIRKKTDLTLDVHLMMTNPERYVKAFADAGADILTVHVEVEADLPTLIKMIRDSGMKPGATLKPGSSVEKLLPHLPSLDMALVMSVEPGFGGQSFMADQLGKVRVLRKAIDDRGLSTEIEIDGGIGPETARQAVEAGVDVLVAGSALFKGGDFAGNLKALRQAICDKGTG